MIFVTLGTQDKSFSRLLKQIDADIEKGKIKEDVVVQAGYTFNAYRSDNMQMFDYVDAKTISEFVKKSRLIISHAGAGSILTALENNKKIIVVPRLKKYGEHNNDHQLEIAQAFSEEGYVIYLKDISKLSETIDKIDDFEPKKLGHNHAILDTIEEFIDNI